jgi:aminopeptidase N
MCEYGNKGKAGYSYSQGMVMFTVLFKWLGQEKFNMAIRSFYDKYHSTGATTKDFTKLWEETLPTKGLKEFFDDWVYTTNYTSFIKNDNTIDEIVKHYTE